MPVNRAGCSERPNPGWIGAIRRARSARWSSTGAPGDSPMPGWRNRSGRPRPRSINSIRTPSTASELILPSAAMAFPFARDWMNFPHAVVIGCEIPAPGICVKWGSAVPDTDTSKTEVHRGITYATHDGVALQGDLYLPAGPGPFPVIVNVHGGYWRRGSRDTFQYWGPYLAARGYAGFTIGYRLTQPRLKTYPEAVHDVRAAVQFMRGRAAEFRLDGERFALWGNSAGAQLGAL